MALLFQKQAEAALVDLGEVDDVVRRLRPHHKRLRTAKEADAAAGKLLREEAIILQSLGEGPVEEFRDVCIFSCYTR